MRDRTVKPVLTPATLLATLALWLCSGCAVVLAPQAARPIANDKMRQQGAMADSPQAHKVAFFANPGAAPERIAVNLGIGGTHVLAAQWTTWLAYHLNQAVAYMQRYDTDFQELGASVFAREVVNGDVIFAWRPAEGQRLGSARAAVLRLTRLEAAASTDGVVARGWLEVSLGDFLQVYAAEVITPTDWMNALMERLGTQVLGDPKFWLAVQSTEKPKAGVLKPATP
jgi:hypothetical protein